MDNIQHDAWKKDNITIATAADLDSGEIIKMMVKMEPYDQATLKECVEILQQIYIKTYLDISED